MEKFQSPTTVVTTKVFRKSVSLLYIKALDSYTENEACPLIGRRVVDVGGKKTGSLRRIWLDPSTYHVEFAGVRCGWLFPCTCVVPARDIRIDEESDLIRLEHPRAFISKAPAFHRLGEVLMLRRLQETQHSIAG